MLFIEPTILMNTTEDMEVMDVMKYEWPISAEFVYSQSNERQLLSNDK
jgi:hypothetical protein